ncbi:MAG: YtxH domain-containing protein [Elusimicrobiota bacterium]
MQDNRVGKALGLFIFGAVAGAVAGVLFAPRSGKETRENIGSWLKHRREQTKETISELREKTHLQKEKLLAAVKAGREVYKQNEPKNDLVNA